MQHSDTHSVQSSREDLNMAFMADSYECPPETQAYSRAQEESSLNWSISRHAASLLSFEHEQTLERPLEEDASIRSEGERGRRGQIRGSAGRWRPRHDAHPGKERKGGTDGEWKQEQVQEAELILMMLGRGQEDDSNEEDGETTNRSGKRQRPM